MASLSMPLIYIAFALLVASLVVLLFYTSGHGSKYKALSLTLTLVAVLFIQLAGVANIVKTNDAGWQTIFAALFIAFVLGHYVAKHDLFRRFKSTLTRQTGIQR